MPRLLQVYHDVDISPAPLAGASVTIVGYGGQGRAQALNLRDGGFPVTVALPAASRSRERAAADGFAVEDVGPAMVGADVVVVLIPDEIQGAVIRSELAPGLKPGALLVFAHGAAVSAGEAPLPAGTDVVLVAPMGPGSLLRDYYVAGGGLNAKVAVAQDATGGAWWRALAYARALGCGRAGVFATTFAEETRLDLFSEQAVLCGGIPALATAAFETLVAAGYPPPLAYIECVREIKYIADLIFAHGLDGMRGHISTTALYGGATRGPRIVGAETRAALTKILAAIEDGSFQKEMRARFEGRERIRQEARNDALEEARREFERLTTPPEPPAGAEPPPPGTSEPPPTPPKRKPRKKKSGP